MNANKLLINKFKWFVIVFIALIQVSAKGQSNEQKALTYSVFLIGDAGEPHIGGSPQIKTLEKLIHDAGSESTTIFLGDNIYPKGMPHEDDNHREEAEKIIRSQIQILEDYAGNAILMPGNHDWEKGKKNGMYQNIRQEEFVEDFLDGRNVYLPDGSCPGPVEISLNDEITLLIVDTQWILHPWEKPRKDDGCQVQSSAELIDLFEDALKRNAHKKIIVATHHPMISYGIHGGVTTIKDHIFPLTAASKNLYIPLPVIGSIYPFYRKFIGSLQDITNPKYRSVRNEFFKLFENYPDLIHVAGHEHNLQYSVKDSIHYVVSGAGSKTTTVKRRGYARFVKESIGFARLDFYNNGAVDLSFIQSDGKVIWKDQIMKRLYVPPEIKAEDFKIPPDSTIETSASKEFLRPSSDFWLVGKNYRDVWASNVEVPVFDIGTERGGLEILQQGGGMQTRSLRLESDNDKQYVLRSIKKYTEKVVPQPLRETLAADLIQDQLSSSHPYAAFAVQHLAEAAGIYHTNPRLVYLPDDPRLDIYRSKFGGNLYLYEERPDEDWEDADFFGNSENIVSTSSVIEQLRDDNDNRVDQKWVLKSRIFDLFIGDWDRHDDQWRWAEYDKGKGELYRPIPRDRDQAFFVSEGFLMSIVKRKWAMPKFQGFDYTLKNPAGFMFNARYFDRDFLSEMDKEDWLEGVRYIQSRMTDSVIENSIKTLPQEVFNLSGNEIISKLKVRREKLDEWALDYYYFLSKEVNIKGSDKEEYFKVDRLEGDQTRVRVYKKTDKDKKDKLLYDRTFLGDETRELRLYGLKDDDRFKVDGKVRKGIKIRIIGGGGKDKIIDESRVSGLSKKTIVYDKKKKTDLELGKESVNKTRNNPDVNFYNRKDFKYDLLAPLVLLNYNVDDGIFIGGGFLSIRHGFRKDPFKSRHILYGSVALATLSWDFRYKGTYTDLINKFDLNLNLVAQSPNYVTNFFGLGNDSFNDQDANDIFNVDDAIDYYRVRYEHYSAEVLLEKDLGTKASFSFGTHWQAFETREDYDGEDRFILDFARNSGDVSIFDWKLFQGLVYKMNYDSRDHKVLPKMGILWNLDLRGYAPLNNASNRFTRFQSDVSFYYTFLLPSSLTLAARVGSGFNRGSYEYYQGQELSGPVHIRGFRKTRFIGDERVYGNFEMRYALANIRNRLVPARIGLHAFYDIGRVWLEGEDSDTWHKGFGGGIWLAPLDATVLALEVGNSVEETRFYFRIGFMF